MESTFGKIQHLLELKIEFKDMKNNTNLAFIIGGKYFDLFLILKKLYKSLILKLS